MCFQKEKAVLAIKKKRNEKHSALTPRGVSKGRGGQKVSSGVAITSQIYMIRNITVTDDEVEIICL